MLAKRIIPCLDVRDGVVVKGVNFVGIKEVGDPVDCAIEYDRQGADEITFLDITATHEGRSTMIEVVRETARNVFVPLTVGGGIRSVEDFRALLRAGADKISVNSAAVRDPKLISEAAEQFGSQCVVVAIDARRRLEGGFTVVVNGGRIDMGLDTVEWARTCERLGAGEILLTSMDTDGCKNGFDLELTRAGVRRGADSGHCVGRLREARALLRGLRADGRGRRARRVPLSFPRIDGRGGQGPPRGEKYPGQEAARCVIWTSIFKNPSSSPQLCRRRAPARC